MKVVNDNNIGNPYHDEEGKFTTPDGVGNGGSSAPSSGDDYTDDDLLGLYDELFGDDVEENEELQKIFGEISDNTLLPVSKMTEQQIILEIEKRIENLKNKNMIIKGPFFANDLVLKLGSLRQLDLVTDKYNIKFSKEFLIQEIYDPDEAVAWIPTSASYGYDGGSFILELQSNGIIFNKYDMFNMKETGFMISGEQSINGWVKTSKDFYPEVVACHECGHILCNSIFNEMIRTKSFDVAHYLYAASQGKYGNKEDKKNNPVKNMIDDIIKNEIMERVFEIYTVQNPGLGIRDFEREKSKYGRSCASEWFAETFASMNGGEPTKSALALQEYLNGFFNFNGGNK